jgi:hypothetical protein
MDSVSEGVVEPPLAETSVKRLTRWSQRAQDKVPAAFSTDRPALPRNPVDSTVLRMQPMEAGNGVTSSRSRRGGHLTESVPTTYGWRARCPKKLRPGVTPRIC